MRFAVLSTLLLLGCGSSAAETPAPGGGGAVEDAAVEDARVDDVAVEEVAATPCGRLVDQTLCDLDVEGYFRAGETTGTAKDGVAGPYKLRDILAKGTEKYAFVFLSGYW